MEADTTAQGHGGKIKKIKIRHGATGSHQFKHLYREERSPQHVKGRAASPVFLPVAGNTPSASSQGSPHVEAWKSDQSIEFNASDAGAEASGIDFLSDDGVRFRPSSISRPHSLTFHDEQGVLRNKNIWHLTSEAPQWGFGSWAYYMTYYTSVCAIGMGVSGSYHSWYYETSTTLAHVPGSTSLLHYTVNIFTIMVGSLFFFSVHYFPLCHHSGSRRASMFKAIVAALVSLPMYLSLFTTLAGAMYGFVAMLSSISAYRGERGKLKKSNNEGAKFQRGNWNPEDRRKKNKSNKLIAKSRLAAEWLSLQENHGHAVRWSWLALWIVINIVLFYRRYNEALNLWTHLRNGAKASGQICWINGKRVTGHSECDKVFDGYRSYIPIAKGSGLCLNLNCALLIFLSTQGVVKRFSNASARDDWLAWMFNWFPLSRHVYFHKCLARGVYFLSVVHMWGHFMAQSFTLPYYDASVFFARAKLGSDTHLPDISKWWTGCALQFLLVVIFAVSRASVRRMMYAVFYYTHIAIATAFTICLFWHSDPWIWFGGAPCVLYVIDVVRRTYLSPAVKPALLQVSFAPHVMELVFDKPWNFRAGQYVLVRCPIISKWEAHPLTISSAPEDPKLKLNIKVWPRGWTEAVREELREVIEECACSNDGTRILAANGDAIGFDFASATDRGTHFGHSIWKGMPLFQLDGPHSTPAIHYGKYATIIFAAAGIGLTPMNSILRMLTKYEWPGVTNQPCLTRNVYAVWLCRAEDVQSYSWFLQSLREVEEAVKNVGKYYCYELHIFVTSKTVNGGSQNTHNRTPNSYATIDDLATADQTSTMFPDVVSLHLDQRMNAYGNTHIWVGRPRWIDLFNRVRLRHQSKRRGTPHRVGVFCVGQDSIVNDVKRAAKEANNSDIFFKVMHDKFT